MSFIKCIRIRKVTNNDGNLHLTYIAFTNNVLSQIMTRNQLQNTKSVTQTFIAQTHGSHNDTVCASITTVNDNTDSSNVNNNSSKL